VNGLDVVGCGVGEVGGGGKLVGYRRAEPVERWSGIAAEVRDALHREVCTACGR
jgi:hypothetical protein